MENRKMFLQIIVIFLCITTTISQNNVYNKYENDIIRIDLEQTKKTESSSVTYQNYECKFTSVNLNYIEIKATHINYKPIISINLENTAPKKSTKNNIFITDSFNETYIYLPKAAFELKKDSDIKAFYIGIECKNCSYTLEFSFKDMIEIRKDSAYYFNVTNNYLTNEAKIIRESDSNDILILLVQGDKYERLWITLEYVTDNNKFTIIKNNYNVIDNAKIALINEKDFPYENNSYFHLIINSIIPHEIKITLNKMSQISKLDMGNFNNLSYYYFNKDIFDNVKFEYYNYTHDKNKYYSIQFKYNTHNLKVYLEKDYGKTTKKISTIKQNAKSVEISTKDLSEFNYLVVNSTDNKEIIFSIQVMDYHTKGKNVLIIVGICLGVFIIAVLVTFILIKTKNCKNEKLDESNLINNINNEKLTK